MRECAEINLFRDSPTLAKTLRWARTRRGACKLAMVLRTKFVKRRWVAKNRESERVLVEKFGPFVEQLFLATSWPGTETFGNPSIVSILEFSLPVERLILSIQPKWIQWREHEGLPEDFCLFNPIDDLPIVSSATHDAAAWLVEPKGINGDFFAKWEDTVSNLRKELNISGGKALFKKWHTQRNLGGDELRHLIDRPNSKRIQ